MTLPKGKSSIKNHKVTKSISNEIKQEDFNIEDLDPDKRSWYYEGDGTKRKKDE